MVPEELWCRRIPYPTRVVAARARAGAARPAAAKEMAAPRGKRLRRERGWQGRKQHDEGGRW